MRKSFKKIHTNTDTYQMHFVVAVILLCFSQIVAKTDCPQKSIKKLKIFPTKHSNIKIYEFIYFSNIENIPINRSNIVRCTVSDWTGVCLLDSVVLSGQ